MTLWAKNQNWSEMSFSLDTRKKGKKFSTPDRLLCCITCAYRWLLEWSHLKMCSKRSHSAKKSNPFCVLWALREESSTYFSMRRNFCSAVVLFWEFLDTKKIWRNPWCEDGLSIFSGPRSDWTLFHGLMLVPTSYPFSQMFSKAFVVSALCSYSRRGRPKHGKKPKSQSLFWKPQLQFLRKKAVKNFMLWNSRKFLVLTIFWLQMYR